MTTHSAYQQLQNQLCELYNNREATNIADWVMEYVTKQTKIERIIHKTQSINAEQAKQLEGITVQLLQYRPVQYVLQEAWFAGMKFYVDEAVLIPRPETDELVEWAVEQAKATMVTPSRLAILDIGTGSGCIPIALKKKLPQADVNAIDISHQALAVARKNADNLQAAIHLQKIDFLDESGWGKLGIYNIIISNPPYIKQSEKNSMSQHVTLFEPNMALFVSDNDPLIFYRKIAIFGQQHLVEGGHIFVEINEALGQETVALFNSCGYSTELKKDLQGKDRMVKASIPF
ncbi:peptide chain release factor N(5)-glutamine methyltransferase [Parasediminibacterium sp. JCM 36343]|uniref:peptide chain release factor N(5)-glutamine methyltransferase n=1 Tax=Parasediminibacterium sp. JCM 36343 TaxID=3374279 RepID=UPI00397A7534